MEKSDLVFVYGTLKQGYGNNALLATSEYLGERTTKEEYVLVGSGCPFMLPLSCLEKVDDYEDDPLSYHRLLRPVRGELYQMDTEWTLRSLDMLESEGSWYSRVLIETNQGESAWSYQILEPYLLGQVRLCSINENGEWQWP